MKSKTGKWGLSVEADSPLVVATKRLGRRPLDIFTRFLTKGAFPEMTKVGLRAG